MTPEGWKEVSVLEVVERVGRVPAIQSSQYRNSGTIPVVDQGQATIAGYTDDESARYPHSLPVIIFGDHTRVWKSINFPFAVGADGTQLLRVRDGNDHRFLFQALSSLPLKNLGYSRHFKLLREQKIILPPLGEQRKIANVLSSVDDAIEATHSIIDQLQVVKNAMMAEFLTRGLPGWHTRFKHTEIGDVPEGWQVAQLSNLVDPNRPITYGIVQPGEHDSTGAFLVRGQDYINGWKNPSTFFRVQPRLHEQYRRSIVRPRDVLLCIVGATTGAVAQVPQWLTEANITQTTARVSCRTERISPEFLRHYLASPLGQAQVRKYIKGSAQPGLNLRDVDKFIVVVPPLNEQQRMADTFDAIEARVYCESGHASALRECKAALLSSLLTGEIRVPLDEASP